MKTSAIVCCISLLCITILLSGCQKNGDSYAYNYDKNGIQLAYNQDGGWEITDISDDTSNSLLFSHGEESDINITWSKDGGYTGGTEGLEEMVENQAQQDSDRTDEKTIQSNINSLKIQNGVYTKSYSSTRNGLSCVVKLTAKYVGEEVMLVTSYTLADADKQLLQDRDEIMDSVIFIQPENDSASS